MTKTGRPKKKNKKISISFSLSAEVIKIIERIAKKLGVNRSQVVEEVFKGE